MSKITLGKTVTYNDKTETWVEAGPCEIDIERLMLTKLLVQANSGGGKSWLLRRLLEQTYGSAIQIIIDTEGEFHTLREKFDYVLAAAKGGDCPADTRSAALLARRLLELRVSCIIDISEMKKADRPRFIRLFLESLIDSPRDLWQPALVIVDEAHLYSPEKEESEAHAAVVDLMSRGRKRGFCGVLATQRISKLSKDAAAECNNKLIGRAALDVDMKRAGDELGFTGREQQHALRLLEAGEFFAFGPAISPQVVRVNVGPVKTTHPEPGNRAAVTVVPPSSKIKAQLAKLADLPKDAEQNEKDVATLRKEVTDLKRQLNAKAPAAAPAPTGPTQREIDRSIRAASDRGVLDGHRGGHATAMVEWEGFQRKLDELLQGTRARFQRSLDTAIQKSDAAANATSPAPVAQRIEHPVPDRKAASSNLAGRTNGSAVTQIADGLSRPQQRILNSLATWKSMGHDKPSNAQVAWLADYSPTSTSYTNPRGALSAAGLIAYPAADRVTLTDTGDALASPIDINGSLLDHVVANLGGPEARILRAVAEFGEGSNEEIATAANYSASSTSYTNPRGSLSSKELITYPAPGRVALAEWLRP